MRRRRCCAAAARAGAALPARCTSPQVDLYTLAAVPGTAPHISARSVELRRVGLAGYLDRPEIVRSAADYRLQLSEQERWGEPLGGMIGRVFVRGPDAAPARHVGLFRRAARSPRGRISCWRSTSSGFDTDADGAVVLVAQIGVRHDERQRREPGRDAAGPVPHRPASAPRPWSPR